MKSWAPHSDAAVSLTLLDSTTMYRYRFFLNRPSLILSVTGIIIDSLVDFDSREKSSNTVGVPGTDVETGHHLRCNRYR